MAIQPDTLPKGGTDAAALMQSETASVSGRAPHIALLVMAGVGNLGNDASLAATLDLVRRLRPQADISAIVGEAADVERDLRLPCINISRRRGGTILWRIVNRLLFRGPDFAKDWATAFRFLKTTDALVIGGTGALDDYVTTPSGWPYFLFMWCTAARACNVPIIFLSVGAGPITVALSRRLLTSAAKGAAYRSYRDSFSLEFMRRIGVYDVADHVFPDLVFGSEIGGSYNKMHEADRPYVIGINVMEYYGWSAPDDWSTALQVNPYINIIAGIIKQCVDGEYEVHLLTSMKDDFATQIVLQRVAELAASQEMINLQIKKSSTIREHAKQLSEVDVVVACRYHTVIASLMCTKPTIALGYSPKFRSIMDEVGLSRYCHSAETCDIEKVADQITELIASESHIASRLACKLQEFRRRLNEQEALLDRCVLPGASTRSAS